MMDIRANAEGPFAFKGRNHQFIIFLKSKLPTALRKAIFQARILLACMVVDSI